MEQTYTFYELGYLEYIWYFIYSLYYKFLEYPLMIRACSIVLIGLILIIPISVIILIVRNQLILRKKNKLKRVRERYSGVFREILTNTNNLNEDIVRDKILDCRGKNHRQNFRAASWSLFQNFLPRRCRIITSAA